MPQASFENCLLRTCRCIALLACLLLVACSAVPLNDKSKFVSLNSPEVSYARAAEAEMISKFPAYENDKLQRYVNKVSVRLIAAAPATDLPIRVQVLDSPGEFAFSFAHGDIVVSRGMLLLLENESQLAAILAHEIGHIVLRHQAQSIQAYQRAQALDARLRAHMQTSQAKDALDTLSFAKLRGFSRESEIEADTWSERLLQEAGYPPTAMGDVLHAFVSMEARWDQGDFTLWDFPDNQLGGGVFATHPSSKERFAQARKRQPATAATAVKPEPAYLAAIDGVRLGLPGHLGIERDQRYVHPERLLGFSVPDGWYVFGAGNRLGLASRHFPGLIGIAFSTDIPLGAPGDALKKIIPGSHLVSQAHFSGNGTYSDTAQIISPDGSYRMRLAVIDVGKQRLYLFTQAYEKTASEKTDQTALQLLQAIHPVTDAEAATMHAPLFTVAPAARQSQAAGGSLKAIQ